MNKLKSATRIYVFLFCQLLSGFFSVAQAAIVTAIDNPKLIEVAKTLPNQGVLRQSNNGYTYLELDPGYSLRLPPLLNVNDLIFDQPKIGAHITVFTAREAHRLNIFSIPELNNTYTFQVIGLNRVITKHCVGMQDGNRIWYVLSIATPELMALRNKYGLMSSKFNFHISLAYQQIVNPNHVCEKRLPQMEMSNFFQ